MFRHLGLKILVFGLVVIAAAGFRKEIENGEEFDYIIVGGGTAGCVIAGRLAESGEQKVLVIEDGGIPTPTLDIPGINSFTNLQNTPNEVKYYASVPQRNAALEQNGIVQYAIGKTIGGGTSINGMIWNRGHPQDFNNWARLSKDNSWSYQNLLELFKKTENYKGFNPTDFRGYHGPVTITNPTYPVAASGQLFRAGQEIGYPIRDGNGLQEPSVTKIDFSVDKRGRRVTAYTAYVKPLEKNKNLVILLNTEAKKIIFEGRRAVGVTFNSNNSSGYAKARKEIILTAGVMDSPLLLMRSGIGPEEVLRRSGIPILKALPVGENLHNHVAIQFPIIYGNRSAVFVPSRDLTPEAWRVYQETGRGPYSSYMGATSQILFVSDIGRIHGEEDWPDLQILPLGLEAGGLQTAPDLKPTEAVTHWRILAVRPKSRGVIKLSKEGRPILDFRIFTHPDVLQIMLNGVKMAERLCEETHAFQRVGCRISSVPLPACRHHKFKSDSYWTCFIKQLSTASIHAAGTCHMGSGPDDPEAVVDSQLKVIGVEGLRVADASVMPAVTNANTQAPVYAIAEKAAEMILNEETFGWQRSHP